MVANLHLHSRYSDGTLWPEELAPRVAAAGVEYAALTDHDSLAGTEVFMDAAAKAGFTAVAGCEIDCASQEFGYRSELLAYFPGGGWATTGVFLEGLAKARAERLFAYLEGARKLFRRDDLSYDDLLQRKYGERAFSVSPYKATLSKVDFWLYLRARGVPDAALDYRAFRKVWLDSGKLEAPKTRRTTVEEVANVVRKDGGVLVLPHVGHEFEDSASILKSDRRRFRRLLAYFKDAGVAGVELYHYRNGEAKDINDQVAREAGELGLFVTFGSDCHGPGSGKETLGEFQGDFTGFPGFPSPNTASRP